MCNQFDSDKSSLISVSEDVAGEAPDVNRRCEHARNSEYNSLGSTWKRVDHEEDCDTDCLRINGCCIAIEYDGLR